MESQQSGAIKEIPYKYMDDAMDAIRYFAMSYKTPATKLPVYDSKKWAW
jgi:starvation-inducible outer membrane lipoprotein